MSDVNNLGNDAKKDKGYDVVITLSSDYYQALMTINLFDSEPQVTRESIVTALEKKGIVVGVLDDVITSAITNPYDIENVVVAQGTPHVNGKDGEITMLFDSNPSMKPTLNVDGTVDFKNMHFLKPIYAGDILATRSLPTDGTEGLTVTGKTIRCKPGKPKNFKVGKGVKISEDELAVIADATGSIQIDGEKLSIIEMLEIRDDVGVKTGNLEFKGRIVINGNVTTGYSVESEDEIIINGIIEGARIVTKGNLFINGGIQGHDQADIHVEGNIVSKFINNAKVFCGGNIESDAIMHSDIICDGSIHVKGKKALIVGGDISVRYDIEAKTIGSEMGTMTKLKLGVDSKIMDAYQATLEEIKELKETITKLSQASRMLSKQFEQTRNPELKLMMDKTEISRTDYTRQLAESTQKLKESTDLIENLKGSKVKAEEIFPGVKIRIGNNFYNVKSVMHRTIIKRDEGDIRSVNY